MMWFFLIAIIIFFLIWLGKRPNYYRGVDINDFQRFVKGLIKQGTNGSLMFINHQESKRFVQFAKCEINGPGTIINFGFPDAPWSRNYFSPMVEAFKNFNVEYEIQETSDDSDFVTRFIDVNIKVDDIEKSMAELCRAAKIAFKVMKVKENDKFRIHFEGNLRLASIRDKLKPGVENVVKKGGKA